MITFSVFPNIYFTPDVCHKATGGDRTHDMCFTRHNPYKCHYKVWPLLKEENIKLMLFVYKAMLTYIDWMLHLQMHSISHIRKIHLTFKTYIYLINQIVVLLASTMYDIQLYLTPWLFNLVTSQHCLTDSCKLQTDEKFARNQVTCTCPNSCK